MPGYPIVSRDMTIPITHWSNDQSTDQMCQLDSRVELSPEEEALAEESFSVYCKPVELYNIIQRRATKNPPFLQRCLKYVNQAKHKKRIQMEISLPSSINDEANLQRFLPLHIILGKQVKNLAVPEDPPVYSLGGVCTISNHAQGKFILPEMNMLSEQVKSGTIEILFISSGELANAHKDMASFPRNFNGQCFWGKIPMDLLHLSWEKSPRLSYGEKAEILLTVEMNSCLMKSLNQGSCVSFQNPHGSQAVGRQSEQLLQVCITAEELGAKDRSRYDSYTYSDVPTASLPQIIRLRTGNVVFNYRYYENKLQRTEVTEDFTCPFCLVKCASYKGLKYHLTSSHDLFNYEFWVTEEHQAVNISVKTEAWNSEMIAEGADPKKQTFFFCSKALKRRNSKNVVPDARNVHPVASGLPGSTHELPNKDKGGMEFIENVLSSSNNTMAISSVTAQSYADPECIQSLPGSNLIPPSMLQFAKSRKLSIERSDHRNRSLLRKRDFFHSHRAQPMLMEQVLSEQDSEDEVDDDVADLEDRRMLDDFVDVTTDEKKMMHLWNSFIRKERVLADGHIPWASEAFTKLHGQDFVKAPGLLWCWKMFMIKLWNHGLLDPRTMNACNLKLEEYQKQTTAQPVENLKTV